MSALGTEFKLNLHLDPIDGLHMSGYDFECALYVYNNRKVVIPKSKMKKVDDDNVYRKLQGHWFIEFGELTAKTKAQSIEEFKAFLTRQKETYKTPYDKYPQDHLRQCVFCGTSNDLQFLPFDRSGNRRFAPVLIDPAKAEHHILEDEQKSRAYIEQMWAEAMEIYRSGNFEL